MRETPLHVRADHPAFDGHFPGEPLLPGVALLAEVMEAALDDAACARLVGAAPRIGAVKFVAPVRPGAELWIRLDAQAHSVRFEVVDASRVVASGHFEASA